MTGKKSKVSRRKLLKSIAAGSGAVVAGKSIPESWSKPVINSVLLPIHAETSDGSGELPGGTLPPPIGPPPTTRPPTNLPPISGILICDANGRNCIFEAFVLCSNTVNLGEIFANDSVRVILWGFSANAPITIDTSSGNHSCNNCPATTNDSGIADMLFSTGNRGDHLTVITVDDCVLTVNWTATNPAGMP